MASKIISAALVGLDAELVEVESDISSGTLGTIALVGLPDTAVSESRERVRSAIKNTHLFFPKRRVVINLAPADLRKYGPAYDLPIAISVLKMSGQIKEEIEEDKLFIGELALDGRLRAISGILPIAIKAHQSKIKTIFLPKENAREAKLVKDLEVIPLNNLKEVVEHLNLNKKIDALEKSDFSFHNKKIFFDMAHIKGQEHVKRAMEISAAGAHNMNMTGPPGSGKTLIARTMPSILPDLSLEEALEVTKIYSVSGMIPPGNSLITTRPFRSPHHSASGVALVGGGAWPKPGEISLAHRGVLFLDEFPEFPRQVLENLRQPLEDGIIHISRAQGNLSFPAKFILISAMNPCPCGFYGDKEKKCTCSPGSILNYSKKISGPIIDRIDLHIEVPRINFEKLSSDKKEESSLDIKKRVEKTRKIQTRRFKNLPFITNSEMSSEAVKNFCPLSFNSERLLKNAVEQMHLSPRSYFRILKLARTIADLDEKEKIEDQHIAEALQYRPKEIYR